MNEMQVYSHPVFGSVRAVMIDGEPWFVGRDAASVLGYSNPSKGVSDHVDEDDRKTVPSRHPFRKKYADKPVVFTASGFF